MSLNVRINTGTGGNQIAGVTSKNALLVDNAPASQTYMGATGPFSPPATPTDMVSISGSFYSDIYILKMILNTTQTTLGYNTFYLKKYSSLNAGGTSTAVVPGEMDPNNNTSQAVMKFYSVNPTTLGNLVYTLDQAYIFTPQVTGGAASVAFPYIWDFTASRIQPLTIRGPQDQVSLNFAGAALPTGLKVSLTILWIEEMNQIMKFE
jgi:hypothetical protein